MRSHPPATGWGDAWLAAVARLYPESKGRMTTRARTFFKGGRVLDVQVDGGTVRARVLGYHRVPYQAVVTVRPIADDVWDAARRAAAAERWYGAALHDGVLPPGIDAVFEAAGEALLPRDSYAVVTHCQCGERGVICDHALSVHLWIAAALERDPFLVLALRGGSRGRLLDDVSATGGAMSHVTPPTATHVTTPSPAAQQHLGPEAAGAAFDVWRAPVPAMPVDPDPDAAAPDRPDRLLAQLGDPPGWDAPVSLHETLAPLYRGAARRARALRGGKPPT